MSLSTLLAVLIVHLTLGRLLGALGVYSLK
jgi:hypothetical protein